MEQGAVRLRRRPCLAVVVAMACCSCLAASEMQVDDAIQKSKCTAKCFENGSCNEELSRCDCVKGKYGADCSKDMDKEMLEIMCHEQLHTKIKECLHRYQPCLNDCNQLGTCTHGTCKCKPGTFGADCSLALDITGQAVLLPKQGYKPRAKRPLVYVYELPPEYVTWMSTRRMDRSLHIFFWQQLLGSGARTADPKEADWFYIPMRMRSIRDSGLYLRGIAYINTTWPYLQQFKGKRHFAFHTGDLGLDEMSQEAHDAVPNMTWLTHWGLYTNNDKAQWNAAHRPDKDIVVPVYISPHHFAKSGMERSPLNPLFPKPGPAREKKLFFSGRICGDRAEPHPDGIWPICGPASPGYSGGVRQEVFYHHHNRSDYKLATRVKSYDHWLLHTRFCLAPTGGGHGQRQILVSFMGCVPVPIGDNIYQPFEPQLDWSKFSLQLRESQIPELHTHLDGVGPQQLATMQAALRCAAQHFVWSGATGGFMEETGQFDAFETVLEVLRVKLDHPLATPYEFQDLDAQFRRFMLCGADVLGGTMSATWLAAQGPQFSAAVTKNPLCSHTRLGTSREPPCYRCMVGKSNTHGVPGGYLCCNSQDLLGTCPRVWD